MNHTATTIACGLIGAGLLLATISALLAYGDRRACAFANTTHQNGSDA